MARPSWATPLGMDWTARSYSARDFGRVSAYSCSIVAIAFTSACRALGDKTLPPKRPERSRGMRKNPQAAQKCPDARRRLPTAREAYSLYGERAAKGANEADGLFSAAAMSLSVASASARDRRSVVEPHR